MNIEDTKGDRETIMMFSASSVFLFYPAELAGLYLDSTPHFQYF